MLDLSSFDKLLFEGSLNVVHQTKEALTANMYTPDSVQLRLSSIAKLLFGRVTLCSFIQPGPVLVAHSASQWHPQGRIMRVKISTLWSDASSTDGSFDASWRQGGAWVTHECFQKGVAGARRGRSGCRWGLAGAALHIAGTSQEALWASLGPRRGRSGRR